MKQIIRKILKESDDLDWIRGNPISVGKCFTLYKSDGSIDAIVTIKEMEQREWKDNIYQKGGKFDPDNVTIHLVGVNKNAKERVGSNFRISYNDLVENINDGDLAPTDCGNNINESDDLQWIRDVEPPNFNFLVGKALYFEPYIDNMVDLKRILEVLSGMGFTYGPWANGVSFEDEEEIVGLYLDPRHKNIVYTDFISEDYEEHISEWAGKPVEVLDGWLTLESFLYSNKKKL